MKTRACAGVVIALALAAGVAHAESPNPAAKQHYDAAMAAYGLGHYAEAAEEFEKTYQLRPLAPILFDAAQAHRAAGNTQRALTLFQNYLRLYGSQVSNGADVRRIVEQLKAAPANAPPPAAPPPTAAVPPAAATPSPAPPAPPTEAPAAPVTTSSAPAPTSDAAAGNALVASAPEKKPVYKRPWFWGAVAGGVVVVGVAVALGVVYGSSTKNPTPSLGTWAY